MTQSTRPLHVLVVDDSPEDCECYRRYLGREADRPLNIREAETVQDALEACRDSPPDCVLLDLQLPDGDGADVLEGLGATTVHAARVVVLTGHGSEELAVDAMKGGASDYLVKGSLSAQALWRAVERAVERTRLLVTIAEQQREKDGLIAQLRDALEQVRTLRGILPICSSCKKVRDSEGQWETVEVYVGRHTEAEFSHGLCPDCLVRLYPAYAPGLGKP